MNLVVIMSISSLLKSSLHKKDVYSDLCGNMRVEPIGGTKFN